MPQQVKVADLRPDHLPADPHFVIPGAAANRHAADQRFNFIIHCGGEVVDLKTLRKTPTPVPVGRWHPIPHYDFQCAVREMIEGSGLAIRQEEHALAKDADRYFGFMRVGPADAEQVTADTCMILGLRNSHDKRFPASLAAGNGVFVCDNLSFSGEVVMKRKHTKRIMEDLPGLVERAIGEVHNLWGLQEERFDAYSGLGLQDEQVHDLLVRAIDCKAIPPTMLPKVLSEWREPSFEDFKDRTVWSLFNHFTTVMRGTAPPQLLKRTQALHGLLDSAVGLAMIPEAEVVG